MSSPKVGVNVGSMSSPEVPLSPHLFKARSMSISSLSSYWIGK
jgi:hypothetical protein